MLKFIKSAILVNIIVMIQVKSYRYMLTGIFGVAKVNIGHLLSFWKSNAHEF